MTFKSDKQPLCRYCGGPIKKRTVRYVLTEKPTPGVNHLNSEYWKHVYHYGDPPKDRAGCARFTNSGTVLSVSYRKIYERDANDACAVVGKHIDGFSTWDGETYDDEFFCNGDHAKSFAYATCRQFPDRGTRKWVEALAKRDNLQIKEAKAS